MRWLLRLYPRAWRDRYEEEMLAVLEDHKVTLSTIFDLVIGAIDANLHYVGLTDEVMNVVNRLRSSMVMTFCAFMLFGVGWSMLQRLTDPMNTFQAAAHAHPELSILHSSVFVVGCLAFSALFIGGLPVFWISVKKAFRKRQRNALIPFWLSISCLVLFALATGILADWHHIAYAESHPFSFIIGYVMVFSILLIVGTISVSLVIARTEFELSDLRFVLIPEIVILFSMIAAVVLSTILIVLVTVHAPQLFHSQDVSSPMFMTGVVLMTFGTIITAMALRRGTLQRI